MARRQYLFEKLQVSSADNLLFVHEMRRINQAQGNEEARRNDAEYDMFKVNSKVEIISTTANSRADGIIV